MFMKACHKAASPQAILLPCRCWRADGEACAVKVVSLADATGDETQRMGHVEREAAILRRLQDLPQVVRLLEGPLYSSSCAFLVFR